MGDAPEGASPDGTVFIDGTRAGPSGSSRRRGLGEQVRRVSGVLTAGCAPMIFTELVPIKNWLVPLKGPQP
jgi:hypothetical protein